MKFSQDAHWRDSARNTRFFIIDYRAAFPLLLFLLHIRLWTFIAALLVTIFLALVERYGFTVSVFGRMLRSLLSGPRKYAKSWWKN
ncbi:MAG: IcmT/TraK family protein [Pseudomonadota bacterium]